jgi:ubiquitin C-terminal hydrolase
VSPQQKRAQDLFATDYPPTAFHSPPAANDDVITEFASPPPPNPMAILDAADQKDPRQSRLSFSTTTARKRKRLLLQTPPRRLALSESKASSYETSSPPAPLTKTWKGLLNLGNTCYLNASLQMLATLTSPRHGNWWNGVRGKGGPVSEGLLRILDQLRAPPRLGPRALNPRAVKQAMDVLTDKFRGYEQRDAHEFLNDLIDSVHEELEKGPTKDAEGGNLSEAVASESGTEALVTTKEEETPAGSSPAEKARLPTDDFRLTVEVCLECKSCGYSRSKQELYRHLSLDIVTGETTCMASITAGLAQFFQPEVREIRCEKCSEGTHASQSMRVLSW